MSAPLNLFILLYFISSLNLAAEEPRKSNASTQIENEFSNLDVKSSSSSSSSLNTSNINRTDVERSQQNKDLTNPNWNYRNFQRATGYVSFPTNVLIYEQQLGSDNFLELKFGLEKGSGNSDLTTSSTTQGTTTISSIQTNSATGKKSYGTQTFGLSFNKTIAKHPSIRVFYGIDFYYQSFTKDSYPVGSTTTTTPDISLPSTYTYSESNWGTIEVSRGNQIYLGPQIGADLFFSWFPNISIGIRSSILMFPPSKIKIKTKTRTYSVPITNGNEGTPTVNKNDESYEETNPASGWSTQNIAGSNFSLFGNFVIRYIF